MKYSILQKVSKQICSQKISEVKKTILIREIVRKGFSRYRFHCCVLGIFAYLKKTADI